MKERVLAEAELLAGAKYRLIRDEVGDYVTEYREGERSIRWRFSGLTMAFIDFKKAVIAEELTKVDSTVSLGGGEKWN